MAGFSNYLKDLALNVLFRDTTFSQPANLYVALFSTMPSDAGAGGVELSGTGYARVAIPTTAAAWSAPAAGTGTQRVIDNVGVVDFGTAGSDWAPSGTPCVGFGLYDASSGGNYWGGNSFASSKIIQSGDPVRFNAGALDAILAGS